MNMKVLVAPAGYSAVGQPCDQIHRHVQAAEDTFTREMAGEHPDLRRRCEGMRATSISANEEAEVDVRAMRALTPAEICRAWVVTGYFSAAQMACISGFPASQFQPHFAKRRRRDDGAGSNVLAAPCCRDMSLAASAGPWAPLLMAGRSKDLSLSTAPPVSHGWAPVPPHR